MWESGLVYAKEFQEEFVVGDGRGDGDVLERGEVGFEALGGGGGRWTDFEFEGDGDCF